MSTLTLVSHQLRYDQKAFWRNPAALLEYRFVPLVISLAKIGNELSAAALTRALGGMVEKGSFKRENGSLVSHFRVTDGDAQLTVRYDKILPDLFREGQGIVAQGAFGPDRTFHASQVLAKHDENYMPREVADRLKEKGEWRPDGPETRSSRPQADSAPTRL